MNRLEGILKEKFKPRDGPFFQALSKALDVLYVKRQAYQGGTFVGNHVHKLLKVSYIHNIPTIHTIKMLIDRGKVWKSS